MKNPPTKVVFRRWPKKEGGGVIAIFPQDPSTNDPYTCSAYGRDGGHSSCDPYRLMQITKPAKATDSDVKALIRDLESFGPPDAHYNLDIKERITRYDLKMREKAIRDSRK